jgi:hypothetical protein
VRLPSRNLFAFARTAVMHHRDGDAFRRSDLYYPGEVTVSEVTIRMSHSDAG